MVSLLFSFHQPIILRNYHFLEIGKSSHYFDEEKQEEFVKLQSESCYKPGFLLLQDLIQKSQGAFRCSFALPGYVIDLWEKYTPDLIKMLKDLLNSGCIEWQLQTYYDVQEDRVSKKELKTQLESKRRKCWDWVILLAKIYC
ncbi:MAG: hypothetical protein KTR26_19620 [Flammeovirgaceae bacterium]|nr:hypothetical protein [Flammeovirgaceae bacterium]